MSMELKAGLFQTVDFQLTAFISPTDTNRKANNYSKVCPHKEGFVSAIILSIFTIMLIWIDLGNNRN